MTWLLDLIFRREIRRQSEMLFRRLNGTLYAMRKAEQVTIAAQYAAMPRAEFTRRCGYRFPLPAHLRRQP